MKLNRLAEFRRRSLRVASFSISACCFCLSRARISATSRPSSTPDAVGVVIARRRVVARRRRAGHDAASPDRDRRASGTLERFLARHEHAGAARGVARAAAVPAQTAACEEAIAINRTRSARATRTPSRARRGSASALDPAATVPKPSVTRPQRKRVADVPSDARPRATPRADAERTCSPKRRDGSASARHGVRAVCASPDRGAGGHRVVGEQHAREARTVELTRYAVRVPAPPPRRGDDTCRAPLDGRLVAVPTVESAEIVQKAATDSFSRQLLREGLKRVNNSRGKRRGLQRRSRRLTCPRPPRHPAGTSDALIARRSAHARARATARRDTTWHRRSRRRSSARASARAARLQPRRRAPGRAVVARRARPSPVARRRFGASRSLSAARARSLAGSARGSRRRRQEASGNATELRSEDADLSAASRCCSSRADTSANAGLRISRSASLLAVTNRRGAAAPHGPVPAERRTTVRRGAHLRGRPGRGARHRQRRADGALTARSAGRMTCTATSAARGSTSRASRACRRRSPIAAPRPRRTRAAAVEAAESHRDWSRGAAARSRGPRTTCRTAPSPVPEPSEADKLRAARCARTSGGRGSRSRTTRARGGRRDGGVRWAQDGLRVRSSGTGIPPWDRFARRADGLVGGAGRRRTRRGDT